MNKLIEKIARDCGYKHPEAVGQCEDFAYFDLETFAELLIDECCLKLLDMDSKTKGNHNYYRHAALEIVKHFNNDK